MKNDVFVLCSGSNSKVLKLDKKYLNTLKETHSNHSNHFGVSYGILVTSDHVFVTSRIKKLICVLDLNLELLHILELSQSPIGIGALGKEYFVTFDAAIGVLDINFEKREFTEKKVDCMMLDDRNAETFKARAILRGMCVSNHYIFVTEVGIDDATGGRLLCLQYNERNGQLKMVAAQDNLSDHCNKDCSKNCCPIVVTPHNDAMYYSQGSYDKTFHIVRAIVNGNRIESNKLFDVE